MRMTRLEATPGSSSFFSPWNLHISPYSVCMRMTRLEATPSSSSFFSPWNLHSSPYSVRMRMTRLEAIHPAAPPSSPRGTCTNDHTQYACAWRGWRHTPAAPPSSPRGTYTNVHTQYACAWHGWRLYTQQLPLLLPVEPTQMSIFSTHAHDAVGGIHQPLPFLSPWNLHKCPYSLCMRMTRLEATPSSSFFFPLEHTQQSILSMHAHDTVGGHAQQLLLLPLGTYTAAHAQYACAWHGWRHTPAAPPSSPRGTYSAVHILSTHAHDKVGLPDHEEADTVFREALPGSDEVHFGLHQVEVLHVGVGLQDLLSQLQQIYYFYRAVRFEQLRSADQKELGHCARVQQGFFKHLY